MKNVIQWSVVAAILLTGPVYAAEPNSCLADSKAVAKVAFLYFYGGKIERLINGVGAGFMKSLVGNLLTALHYSLRPADCDRLGAVHSYANALELCTTIGSELAFGDIEFQSEEFQTEFYSTVREFQKRYKGSPKGGFTCTIAEEEFQKNRVGK